MYRMLDNVTTIYTRFRVLFSEYFISIENVKFNVTSKHFTIELNFCVDIHGPKRNRGRPVEPHI